MYLGTIILESLVDRSVLDGLNVVNTEVEIVTEGFGTSWLKQWTLKTVEIPEDQAVNVAEKISHAIDPEHAGSWFADFANAQTHYVIFRDKVFVIDRSNREKYQEAEAYGLSLGIPQHQLGFLK